MNPETLIQDIKQGRSLALQESRLLFDKIFEGLLDETQMKDLLLALHGKGETCEEINGAAQSMRAHMLPIKAPDGAIDIVGTGGDGHKTYNISTATALVAAGAGAVVAKHGNRAATSLSGSSDVLEELGLKLDAPFDILEKALREIGIAFLFAPRHHPAMRFVAPVRKSLNVRTIFNLLGPLTNPANVKRHLLGVFDAKWAQPMAKTLQALGSENACIVHGLDGMDELSITGPSLIAELDKGDIRSFEITPQDFGLPVAAALKDIEGGDAKVNAAALRRLLDGEKGPYRDIILMNAAMALIVAGQTEDRREAIDRAATSIDSGAAKEKLNHLVGLTTG